MCSKYTFRVCQEAISSSGKAIFGLHLELFGVSSGKIITGCVVLILTVSSFASAQEKSLYELRQEIEKRNEEIRKLEEETEKFRQEVSAHQEKGKTLKEEIRRLDRNIQQLQKDIAITERRIEKLELEIEAVELEIREKEFTLYKFRSGLGALLQLWVEKEGRPIIAALLSYRAISDLFRQIDSFSLLQKKILDSLSLIKDLKEDLEEKKKEAEKKKEEEVDLKRLLSGRRIALSGERQERNYLLRETLSQEKKYQQLLNEREKRIAALAEEIREIEEKIRITIDPSSLPPKGSGVLGWPLPDVALASCWQPGVTAKNCITQFFGYTQFAAVGGYNGKGHNGVDFRASFGTPVLSADRGIVEAVGDTDIGCRGASYGKWILIRHPNNLSTLYAHLSGIVVSQGQEVGRGEHIGFSGSSGYATGPHLHFALFAAQAVEVTQLRSRVCGRMMILPIAPINGYLDPLDYL